MSPIDKKVLVTIAAVSAAFVAAMFWAEQCTMPTCRDQLLRSDAWTGAVQCASDEHRLVRDKDAWVCLCPGSQYQEAEQ